MVKTMERWIRLSFFVLCFPLAGHATCSGNGTWTGSAADTFWSDVGNWSGCVPNASTDGATFSAAANTSVNLNIPVTLGLASGTLVFSSSTTTYTLFGSNTLTLTGPSDLISVAGTQNIGNGTSSPNLIKLSNTTLTINGTGTLNFLNVGLTDAGGSTSNIVISGPSIVNTNTLSVTTAVPGSQINPNGSLTMTGGSLLNVNSGSVNNTAAAANGAFFGAGGPVTLNNVTIQNTNSGAIGSTAAQNQGSVIGVFSGSGTLTLSGSTVNSLNTSTGIVTPGRGAVIQSGPSAGSLVINSSTVNLTNNANLSTSSPLVDAMYGSLLVAGSLTGGLGTFTLNGGTVNLNNTGNLSGDDTPNGIFGTAILANIVNINQGGSIYLTNSGAISQPPSGLVYNTGSGVIAPSAVNVNNGLLANIGNGTTVGTPAINIQSAGTLTGLGQFLGLGPGSPSSNAVLVTNNGTVLPGNPGAGGTPTPGTTPGGTMTIVGNYVQSATGVLDINIQSTGSFSQLSVADTNPVSGAGTASLAGTVRLSPTSGFALASADTFTIVQATNGITGTFNTIVNDFPPGLDPSITYTADAAIVTFKTSIAAATLPIFPGNLAGVAVSLVNQINQINQTMRLERFACEAVSAPSFPSTPSFPIEKEHPQPFDVKREEECSSTSNCETHPWNFYLGPFGIVGGEFHSQKDQVGWDYWTAGALAGFDYVTTHFGIGFVASYDRSSAHVHRHWGKFDIDEVHGSLYAKCAPGSSKRFAFNAIVGGGYQWYDIQRKIDYPPLFVTDAKGSPHGNEYDALFGMQYRCGSCAWEFIPLASVQYIHVNVDSYQERHGDIYNLKFKHQHLKSLRTTLGFVANHTWTGKTVAFTPSINANWQREFLFHQQNLYFTSAEFDEPTSSLAMPAAGRNLFIGGASLGFDISNRYGISLDYSFEWNQLFHDHFLYLGFGFRF